MNLVIIIGAGAVGKMTVGQELMKITNYRLFHNHMMIEPVIEIFDRFNGSAVNKLREVVMDEFIKSDYDGMIFTYMWAFDMQSDWDYLKHVAEKFEASGGTVYYVELVADRTVRVERNKTENRLRNKASKRDTKLSEFRMLREEMNYRLESRDGEIPFEHYIKIDNTNLEPDEVARKIKEQFGLNGVGKAAYVSLFQQMHPYFFERAEIKGLPEHNVNEEMVLELKDYVGKEMPQCPECIQFDYYTGDRATLLQAVGTVEAGWPEFFGESDKVYCAFVDGKIASFCIVENMGTHNLNGRTVKIGGPGCVGTLPECRRKGIGLAMVHKVTEILREQGYDLSYIHWTGVADWYAKLGYKRILQWDKMGLK